MKKVVVFIVFLASLSALEAKKVDRLETRIDDIEAYIRDIYHEMQYLRDCIQELEEKANGPHEHNAASSEE